MRKYFLSALLAFAIGAGAAQAQVVVKIRPPKARGDHRGARPSRDHVWIPGYQRWDGHAYQWEAGRWEKPPHPHAVWVAPKWQHRRDGWVLVEGHWR